MFNLGKSDVQLVDEGVSFRLIKYNMAEIDTETGSNNKGFAAAVVYLTLERQKGYYVSQVLSC